MFVFLRKYGKIILIYFMVGVWIKMDIVKSFGDKCIVNQNDVYLYFEIIRQLKPERVIDAGMFLKRIGAVSRQAMNLEIGADVELCGVDVIPQCRAGIYGVIYDKVWNVRDFLNVNETYCTKISKNHKEPDELKLEGAKKLYDLAFMLRTDTCLEEHDERRIVKRIEREASYLVVDKEGYERNKELLLSKSCRELELEQDRYKIVILK